MTRDSQSRREYLTAIGTAGAAIGGSSLVLSSVSADDATDSTKPDGDVSAVRLDSTCIDEKRDAAVFCAVNDGAKPVTLEWRHAKTGAIEFIDCQTIRVVGDFAEVLVDAVFVAPDGQLGNVIEPFGPVDGDRVIDITESEDVPDDAIIDRADAFRGDTPVVPGGGDVSEPNPEFDACRKEYLGTKREDLPKPDEYIEYLDCQTIRVVGEFTDVAVNAMFVAEDGGIGNVIELFGPVAGDRVIDITESSYVPDDSIALHADAFRDEPITPGGGDVSKSNPDYDGCQEEIFGEIADGAATPNDGGETTTDGSSAKAGEKKKSDANDETKSADRHELEVPANGKTCFPVTAPNGRVTVELLADGTRIDAASSATETDCRIPIIPGLVDSVTVSKKKKK